MEAIHKVDNKHVNKQKGFTLVEIAIVLVIIGLLLGGVLKGQELIKNAKIKSATADVNAYATALIAYQDRFGDLFTNVTNYSSALAANTVPTSAQMLGELAAKGLVSSKSTHALGGNIFLARNGGKDAAATPADLADLAEGPAGSTPLTFTWALCYEGIASADDAKAIIRSFDGGDGTTYTTGRARTVTNSVLTPAATYAAGTVSTVCIEL